MRRFSGMTRTPIPLKKGSIRSEMHIDYPNTTSAAPLVHSIMAESLTKSKQFMGIHPGRISLAA